MSVTITVRDVEENVRAALAAEASERGQSLQAYLLHVLTRQARFRDNRALVAALERDVQGPGWAGEDAPDAADLIRADRPAS